MSEARPARQRGVQSIDTAARLLRILLGEDRPQMLRDIAERAGLTSAQTHSYLQSLKKSGMVRQFGAAGRYGLAEQSLALAHAALSFMPDIDRAMDETRRLARRLGQMMTVDLWINGAPTAVLVLRGQASASISLQEGSRSDLTNSACAWLFEAHHPDRRDAEVSNENLQCRLEVLAKGHAFKPDVPVPGLSALSVPLLSSDGAIRAAISVIATPDVFAGPAFDDCLATLRDLTGSLR